MDWIAAGEKLRSLAGDDWLLPSLRETIDSAARVFIACSGGADSVFLALYFADDALRNRLTVLHFNHGLRGEESDADARFASSLAAGLGLNYATDKWVPPGDSKRISEEAARTARMAFFGRAVGPNVEGAIILTGHHADDVAETMLMRISRGSGLQGLTAPRATSVGAEGMRFVRPLLSLRKSRLVDWLVEAGVAWREDASNQSDCYYRNRLRSEVVPAWEAASDRPIHEGAIASRSLLEEDWRALEDCFESAWSEISLGGEELDWEGTRALPRGLQRRALNRIATEAGKPVLASAAMEGVLEALRVGGAFKVNLDPNAWIAGFPEGRIRIEGPELRIPWTPTSVPLGTRIYFPDGGALEVEAVSLEPERLSEILGGAISHENRVYLAMEEKQLDGIQVRQRQPGDAYPPAGRESSVKLKELFIDRKVARERRAAYPVVTLRADEVLWVPELPPNRKYLLTDCSTRALQLTYEK